MTYWDKLTIERIRRGFYSATYFNRTKYILEREGDTTVVTMQIFQRNENSVLCGVDEVGELLRVGAGMWRGARWVSKNQTLTVSALSDGDTIGNREPIMHVTGSYLYFAHLESLYLGILARRTMVATNTRCVIEAANGKPVFFFADRFDDFHNQEGDGYAAHIGGAAGVCTVAHASRWNGIPVGTIPHALIAVNDGSTVKAAELFAKHIRGVNIVALVDFDNDCVGSSLAVAKALGKKLWGVRLDTAGNMVDKSLSKNTKNMFGVNPTLVMLVRKALNDNGYGHVKILVSGGFTEEKVRMFEKEKTPVDGYGVGSALVHGNNDFTADIVKVNGKRIAKAGRSYQVNSRMKVNNFS
ncbi:MAG: quinolinate phosphoribosyl transferase [Candidatus Gottesmanbacteria bacterium]|nr:quinolinate phosphoribosyl transferase [Candidatus Gottesmanbacteria bacterium]